MTLAPQAPRTSVVILAWPPSQQREHNVFSLLDQLTPRSPSLEVVVVCNGDDDLLAARLREHPRVDVLVTPGANLGVPTGWNRGAAAARGDVLVFANEDVIIDGVVLEALSSHALQPGVGLVGVVGEHWNREDMRPSRGDEPGPNDVLVPAGFLFAVHTDTWRQVGGADDRLAPAFYEEIDLAFKCHAHGLETALLPELSAFHAPGVSAHANRSLKIFWVGGVESVASIHRRNHRLMITTWGTGPLARLSRNRAAHHGIYAAQRLIEHVRSAVTLLRAPSANEMPRNNYLHRFRMGIVSGIAANFLLKVIGLIAVAIQVAMLGVDLFGVLVVALVFLGGQGLVDLGVPAATAKFISVSQTHNDRQLARRVIRYSLSFYALLSVAVSAVFFASLEGALSLLHVPDALRSDARILLLWMIPAFGISNLALVYQATLQGLQYVYITNVILLGAQVAYLVTLAIGWRLDLGVWGVGIALVLLYSSQLAMLWQAGSKRLPTGEAQGQERLSISEFLRYGSTVQLVAVLDFVIFQVPKLVAGSYLGVSAAATFDLASRLPAAAASLATPLLPPLLPAAAQLAARHDRRGLGALLERTTRQLVMLLVPIFAVLVVVGPSALTAWTNGAVTGEAATFRWLALGIFLHTLPGGMTAIYFGMGDATTVARYKGILLLSAAILAVPLTAWLGLAGLAAAIAGGAAIAAGYMGLHAAGAFPAMKAAAGHDLARPVLLGLFAASLAMVMDDYAPGPFGSSAVSLVPVIASIYIILVPWRSHRRSTADSWAHSLEQTQPAAPIA